MSDIERGSAMSDPQDYVPKAKPIMQRETCRNCYGMGKWTINGVGHVYTCPECLGSGKLYPCKPE